MGPEAHDLGVCEHIASVGRWCGHGHLPTLPIVSRRTSDPVALFHDQMIACSDLVDPDTAAGAEVVVLSVERSDRDTPSG
jgi:hypothetical protein